MIRHRFKANRPKITWKTDITPYWKVIQEIINESNIILEILDARMPELSRNKEIEKRAEEQEKELILVLNKTDLVNEKELKETIKKLRKEYLVFEISSKEKLGTRRLRDYLLSQAKKQKDIEFFRIGILGYPNTGKSSVTNVLIGRKKAPVTSKAGATHGPQWARFRENIQLIDSPGVIPIEEKDEARHALIGSKNPEKIQDKENVVREIFKTLKNNQLIESLYKIKIEDGDDFFDITEKIAKKKGLLKRGGEINESQVYIQIIRDWQQGKLRQ